MPRVMARIQAVDRQRAYRDMRATLEWARAQPGVERVVALGICFGGPYALHAAADGIVDAVATWHGSRMDAALDRAAEMQCPMRLHFGEVDPFVAPAAVEKVRAALAGNRDAHIVVHPGATHGFSHRGAPEAYDETAERAGIAALRELVATPG
jgi:carboxymethylenebutenolidase